MLYIIKISLHLIGKLLIRVIILKLLKSPYSGEALIYQAVFIMPWHSRSRSLAAFGLELCILWRTPVDFQYISKANFFYLTLCIDRGKKKNLQKFFLWLAMIKILKYPTRIFYQRRFSCGSFYCERSLCIMHLEIKLTDWK